MFLLLEKVSERNISVKSVQSGIYVLHFLTFNTFAATAEFYAFFCNAATMQKCYKDLKW